MNLRNTFLSIAATAAVGILAPTAAMADTAPSPIQQPQKSLVALGDSITYGYNLDPANPPGQPNPGAFPFLIGQADNYRVTDLGIPGWTSGDLLQAVQTNTQFEDAVRHANVVTVDIGNNDLLHLAALDGLLSPTNTNPVLTSQQYQQFYQAIGQFSVNLAETLARIHRLNPHAVIVLYNIYDPFASASPLHALTEPLIGMENQVVFLESLAFHTRLADAYDAFNGHQTEYILPHDVHPNLTGQGVLAKVGEVALEN